MLYQIYEIGADAKLPNSAEMFSRWSFTRFVKFLPIENSKWLPGPIMCSDLSKFQKSSCQKLQGGLNCYLEEMIVRLCRDRKRTNRSEYLFTIPYPPPSESNGHSLTKF